MQIGIDESQFLQMVEQELEGKNITLDVGWSPHTRRLQILRIPVDHFNRFDGRFQRYSEIAVRNLIQYHTANGYHVINFVGVDLDIRGSEVKVICSIFN